MSFGDERVGCMYTGHVVSGRFSGSVSGMVACAVICGVSHCLGGLDVVFGSHQIALDSMTLSRCYGMVGGYTYLWSVETHLVPLVAGIDDPCCPGN